jgi:hypothetical protein
VAEPKIPEPALLVCAIFSGHAEALTWAAEHLARHFGPVGKVSEPFAFVHTKYYEPSMGLGLQKQLLAFEQLTGQDSLPAIKLATNHQETEFAALKAFSEVRPLNIDPGLLTLGKFVLATTKDQAHRIYLERGIYAEVTLRFQDGQFEPWPWTYADYREPAVRATLKEFRDYYKDRLRSAQRE